MASPESPSKRNSLDKTENIEGEIRREEQRLTANVEKFAEFEESTFERPTAGQNEALIAKFNALKKTIDMKAGWGLSGPMPYFAAIGGLLLSGSITGAFVGAGIVEAVIRIRWLLERAKLQIQREKALKSK